MVKKIKAKQLRPGMYIHDLNCQWLKHPFFGSSMKVENEHVIKKIIKYGIDEVYIDTDKGIDVHKAGPAVEVEEEPHEEFREIVDDLPRISPVVPVSQELIRARRIKKETTRTVQNIMNEVRLGKQIETNRVEQVVDNILESIFRNQDALLGLGRLRKADEYTYNHSMGVCVLMITFGRYLGMDSGRLKEVGVGAMLHDIGKTKIPLDILNKKGTLSREEYEKIKEHVEYGRVIIEETNGMTETSVLTAYQHHERMDGTGYPLGLKGDEISFFGQAIAIADIYDAVTSERCYQRKIQPTQALRMLYEWSGYLLNADLVQKFIRCVGIYPVGSLVRLDNGLLGVVVNHGEKSLLQPVVRIVYDTKKDSYITFPYDIDLAEFTDNEAGRRITGYENPDRWNLVPETYL